ncbi:DUF1003 domain-containing protein [Labrys portucalensis]|uniref:DUF1003 domain-containing protein n=1 Tax=Labrys neptuniae TaxID=376174 RepID=A0ABV3PGM2_9HYPH|nr:DUF1003 domain-containing protein [Labrys neptuniae]MDT3377680.1 DUF1003 domain-containing protein [Labrys neptuniae]
MSLIAKAHQLHDEERTLLHRLRQERRAHRRPDPAALPAGARIADAVAATMGSWPFIIVQSAVLAAWVVLNVVAFMQHWDPYPFILLNLALSFQAAYAAPFIMMSQNRQAAIDRAAATHDYDVNTKAELEIELLHEKIDFLRETQVAELMQLVKRLEEKLDAAGQAPPA